MFILLIIFVNHGILITTADENTDIFASPEISSGSGHVVAAAVPDVDSAHGISSIINANGVSFHGVTHWDLFFFGILLLMQTSIFVAFLSQKTA